MKPRLPLQAPGETPLHPAASKGGSVLVIVLVTLVITALALTAFLDKASSDLIVAAREADARRLRQEAYSALEVTLSVLSAFNQTVGSLHSPAEGWGDPLTFANYTPTEGRTVEVSFEDESGKLSLPNVDSTTLLALFQLWGMTQTDAQRLTDALLNRMKPNYTPTGTFTPDYDQAAIPYTVPGRSLRSFDELASIDVARDVFYGEDGRPNDLWHRFAATFSLLNYRQPNLNSANPDVLAALGSFDATQQQNVSDYLNGAGSYQNQGPTYFRNVRDAAPVIGQGSVTGFSTQISALRIHITVHDGRAVYRLGAVVTLPGQQAAQTVESSATNGTSGASASTTAAPAATPTPAPSTTTAQTGAASAAGGNNSAVTPPKLNYPFTVLEIHENDEPVPVAPPPPPAE
jgi:general secretion pathway protein K